MTAQQSSWGTCGFLLCVMQLATLLGFHTSLTPVGWPPPAVEVSRGVGGVLLQMSCYPTLVFYLVPAHLPLPLLPLRGSAPLPGASACLPPVCWSTPGVVLEGSLLCHLVFLLCAVLFLRACSVCCFPGCRFNWSFQVTGCLSFCFPGDIGWVSALPFFFYVSPAPLACEGGRGYAPCARVLPLR